MGESGEAWAEKVGVVGAWEVEAEVFECGVLCPFINDARGEREGVIDMVLHGEKIRPGHKESWGELVEGLGSVHEEEDALGRRGIVGDVVWPCVVAFGFEGFEEFVGHGSEEPELRLVVGVYPDGVAHAVFIGHMR